MPNQTRLFAEIRTGTEVEDGRIKSSDGKKLCNCALMKKYSCLSSKAAPFGRLHMPGRKYDFDIWLASWLIGDHHSQSAIKTNITLFVNILISIVFQFTE